MRLLVTGRKGQLVRSLVEQAAGHPDIQIVTTGRPKVDMTEPGSLRTAILAQSPDLVVNAAAYTLVDQAEDEPELARRINGAAAGEAAQAAREVGAPIIQISTDYVFDGTGEKPIDEDRPTAPLNSYGASKLAGEEAVRAANPAHVILRTAWVISPFGRNFVTSMLAAARSRPDLSAVADQRGNPTSSLDLASGILRAAELLGQGCADLTGRTFHLAGTGQATWFDLATAIMAEAAASGLPHAAVRPILSSEWPTRALRPSYSVLDCGRFEAATGFAMPDWRGSLHTIVRRLAGAE
ncbi:dTDP-4-dehydrorhamnose reductase [Sphingomonas sp. KRR8]|uniref:dTDP-4-dehydrorhamnose reductase n=1 Tax=Sphingomonas sp. KRR8 TaxID=2942996 RepID=UPI0020204FB1|nr:dTDP-4-dehydrorhamnose reductase [Sphingomonas sp. KRR8]URD61585.1 dTDP-4-dehydrorhamnose reductase [Sphingomonas sp. KRR8]